MNIDISLLKKIRCRFLDRSTGMPVPGVIASLSVAIGDATTSAQFPVATLCTDATGYMSFDLKPLIDFGLTNVFGLFISAPKFGLTNHDLLSLFGAAPAKGAKTQNGVISGDGELATPVATTDSERTGLTGVVESSSLGTKDGEKEDLFARNSESPTPPDKTGCAKKDQPDGDLGKLFGISSIEQPQTSFVRTNGQKKKLSCVVFPVYLETRLQDDHGVESAGCALTSLLSIQTPDLCDYEVSPFSFVTPSALKLGDDCCETLLPSSLPIEQYCFNKIVVRREETGPEEVLNIPFIIEMTPRGVLLASKSRTAAALNQMSTEDIRNTLIVVLSAYTNQPGGYFQGFNDDTLVGKCAVMVFLRAAGICDDNALKNMSDDDERNNLIVENMDHSDWTIPQLQGMSDQKLVQVGLGWFARRGEVRVIEALKSQAPVIKFGDVLEYRQEWYSLGHSLGEIKYSLPLAPGESTQLAVIEWSRDDLASRTDQIRATEFLDHDSHRDRAIEETVDAALKEEQGGNSHFGGTSGTASGQTYGTGTWTGNHAFGGGISYSYGKRDLEGEALQDLHDRVRQASSSIRSLKSTVIVQASQTENNALQTRRVANHNHCHALTIQYYEVLRHYRLSTKFAGRRKAVLVPFAPFAFKSWDLALRFRTVLEQTLLDPSLKSCFDALIRLNLAPSVYEAPQLPVPVPSAPPKLAFAQKTLKVEGLEPNGVASDVKVRTDDTITITSSGVLAMAPNLNDWGYGGFPPEGDGKGAPGTGFSWPFVDGDLASYSLIYKIGETGKWRQGVTIDNKTPLILKADGDGEIFFNVNNSFNHIGHYRNSFWTVNIKFPSHDTDAPSPSKDQISNNADLPFRKSDDQLGSARLLRHLQDNQGYYNSAVWMLMNSVERRLYLEQALHDRIDILTGMDDRPLAISGNYVAFQFNDPLATPSAKWSDLGDDERQPVEDIVTLPTRGSFAEAQMGHCNSCEKRDVTRMWNWTEMTAETPPEISGISPGPKGVAPSITPLQLPSNVIQITQPQAAPDPTGLVNALSVLKTPDIFRDMAGLDKVSKLLGELARDATDANTKAMALQGQIEIEKIKADAKKDGTGNGNGNSGMTTPSGVSAADAADRFSLLPEIKSFAKDIGLTDAEYKQFALDQIYGTGRTEKSNSTGLSSTTPGASDVGIIEGAELTADRRAFTPSSQSKSGTTSLSVHVSNLPSGGSISWSVPASQAGRYTLAGGRTTQNGNKVDITALSPGLSQIDVQVRDVDGIVVQSLKYALSMPQFITVDTDPTFNALLGTYSLIPAEIEEVLRVAKGTCDTVLSTVNVRTIWLAHPFKQALPPQFAAGGVAAANVTRAVFRGDPPSAAMYGLITAGVTGGIGAGFFDETISVFAGAFDDPVAGNANQEVDEATNEVVRVLISSGPTSSIEKNRVIQIIGRLLGETLAHEVVHSLIGATLSDGPHNARPGVTDDLMNHGRDRSFQNRTGFRLLAPVGSDVLANILVDRGIFFINIPTGDTKAQLDRHFPVPPKFR